MPACLHPVQRRTARASSGTRRRRTAWRALRVWRARTKPLLDLGAARRAMPVPNRRKKQRRVTVLRASGAPGMANARRARRVSPQSPSMRHSQCRCQTLTVQSVPRTLLAWRGRSCSRRRPSRYHRSLSWARAVGYSPARLSLRQRPRSHLRPAARSLVPLPCTQSKTRAVLSRRCHPTRQTA